MFVDSRIDDFMCMNTPNEIHMIEHNIGNFLRFNDIRQYWYQFINNDGTSVWICWRIMNRNWCGDFFQRKIVWHFAYKTIHHGTKVFVFVFHSEMNELVYWTASWQMAKVHWHHFLKRNQNQSQSQHTFFHEFKLTSFFWFTLGPSTKFIAALHKEPRLKLQMVWAKNFCASLLRANSRFLNGNK